MFRWIGRVLVSLSLCAVAACGTVGAQRAPEATAPAAGAAAAAHVVAPAPAPALAPPRWVGAVYVAGQEAVGLRWDPVPGAAAYKVWRSTTPGSGHRELAAATASQYFDRDIAQGTTYHYVLQSVSGTAGSALSDERSVLVPAPAQGAIEPPRLRKPSANETGYVQAHLSWTTVESAIAYNVYRRETGSNERRLIDSTSETAFVDTKVEPGKTYSYSVSALDVRFRESALSGEEEVLLTVSQRMVEDRVAAEIAAISASGVKFTDADFETRGDEVAPEGLTRDGAEFVALWRDYRRAMSLRDPAEAGPPAPSAPQPRPQSDTVPSADAANRRRKEFLARLIQGEDPPTPTEVERELGRRSLEELLLARLRHRHFGAAVAMLIDGPPHGVPAIGSTVTTDLLTALGFDWRRVFVGAWLSGKSSRFLRPVCEDPSPETAALLVTQVELHPEKAFVYDNRSLRELLREDNGVPSETKERLAGFLNAQAPGRDLDGDWLRDLPPGAAAWLKPLARNLLHHERHSVRQLAEQRLREAGETQIAAPGLPRYRIFVDGALWIGAPSFACRLKRTGPYGDERTEAGVVDASASGVLTVDTDRCLPWDGVKVAYFKAEPFPGPAGRDGTNGGGPWFIAEVPVPAAPGTATDVRVETTRLTIQPRLPAPVSEAAVTEIGLVSVAEAGLVFGESPPGGQMAQDYLKEHAFRVTGSQPLVLAQAQRGDYWLLVRSPGAARSAWEKVTVDGAAVTFEPAPPPAAATVSVPLSWPWTPPVYDPAGLRKRLILEREGEGGRQLVAPVVLDEATAALESPSGPLVLRDLPAGRYRLLFGLGRPQAAVPFEVTIGGPAQLTTSPLVCPEHP